MNNQPKILSTGWDRLAGCGMVAAVCIGFVLAFIVEANDLVKHPMARKAVSVFAFQGKNLNMSQLRGMVDQARKHAPDHPGTEKLRAVLAAAERCRTIRP